MLTYILLALIVMFIMLLYYRYGENKAQKLVRQIARWIMAANQDESPLVALLHANYAAGYLWALKDIYSANDILALTGVNIDRLEKSVVNAQDSATRKVIEKCPQFTSITASDKYLAVIAGEGI